MSRFAVWAVFVVCAGLAAAAPVPPETDADRMWRLYGEPIDPDKDCRFDLVGDKLRITIPGTEHLLTPKRPDTNVPRVWRQVTGDFEVTVRVTFPIRPGPLPRLPGGAGGASAGLIAWPLKLPPDWSSGVYTLRKEFGYRKITEAFEGGGKQLGITENHDSAYLRMTRKGEQLDLHRSRDGKDWGSGHGPDRPEPWHIEEWGSRILVGVVAENAYEAPFSATFDQYSLTQPKK